MQFTYNHLNFWLGSVLVALMDAPPLTWSLITITQNYFHRFIRPLPACRFAMPNFPDWLKLSVVQIHADQTWLASRAGGAPGPCNLYPPVWLLGAAAGCHCWLVGSVFCLAHSLVFVVLCWVLQVRCRSIIRPLSVATLVFVMSCWFMQYSTVYKFLRSI